MIARESQGAIEVVTPSEAINHENADRLFSEMTAPSGIGQAMMVLDLSEVPLLDSRGLEVLLEIQMHLRQSGGVIKLAGLSQLCEDIFRVTGVAERFEIHRDAKSAVRSYLR